LVRRAGGGATSSGWEMITWGFILDPRLIQQLGWALVHFLWQAAALALLFAIVRRFLANSTAEARYWLACGVLALMTLAPVPTLYYLLHLPNDSGPLELPTSAALPQSLHIGQELLKLSAQVLPWLVRAWMAGAIAMILVKMGGLVLLRRLIRRNGDSSRLGDRFEGLVKRFGIRRAVTFVQSKLVESPATLGWLRPIVLVPIAALAELSPDYLDALIAHELAHIRRSDYLMNVLQTVMETVFFFHPAVWWVSSQIRQERENCCDDMAVRVCGSRKVYIEALAAIEGLRMNLPVAALGAGGGGLLARVERLIEMAPIRSSRRHAGSVVASLLVFALLLLSCNVMVVGSIAAEPRGPGDIRSLGHSFAETLGLKVISGGVVPELDEAVAEISDGRKPNGQLLGRLVDAVTNRCDPDALDREIISNITLPDRSSYQDDPDWTHGTYDQRREVVHDIVEAAASFRLNDPQRAALWSRAALLLEAQDDFLAPTVCAGRLLADTSFVEMSRLSPSQLARLRRHIQDHLAVTRFCADIRLQAEQIVSAMEANTISKPDGCAGIEQNLEVMTALAHQRADIRFHIAMLYSRLVVLTDGQLRQDVLKDSNYLTRLVPDPDFRRLLDTAKTDPPNLHAGRLKVMSTEELRRKVIKHVRPVVE
jgi:beta-lactamase regulating signal transducer with metallopeptidase domain